MLSPPNCRVLFLPIILEALFLLLFLGRVGADADDTAPPLLAGGLPPSDLVGPLICDLPPGDLWPLLLRLGGAEEAPWFLLLRLNGALPTDALENSGCICLAPGSP